MVLLSDTFSLISEFCYIHLYKSLYTHVAILCERKDVDCVRQSKVDRNLKKFGGRKKLRYHVWNDYHIIPGKRLENKK